MKHPYKKIGYEELPTRDGMSYGNSEYYLVPLEDIDNAVEVYSSHCKMWDQIGPGDSSHKALLIRIEPIVKESCADVLREIIEFSNKFEDDSYLDAIYWAKRAKQALGNEE